MTLAALIPAGSSLDGLKRWGDLSSQEACTCYKNDSQGMESKAPSVVFHPRSLDAIDPFVEECRRLNLGVAFRGGGTGLSGGALGDVVVNMRKFEKIVCWDGKWGKMLVEAGASIASINKVAARDGFWLPLPMETTGVATIGGSLASNAKAWQWGRSFSWSDYTNLSSFAGSEGLFGAIKQVKLQLAPRPEFVGVWVGETSLTHGSLCSVERYREGTYYRFSGPKWQVDAATRGMRQVMGVPRLVPKTRRHLYLSLQLVEEAVEEILSKAAFLGVQLQFLYQRLDERLVLLMEGERTMEFIVSLVNFLEGTGGVFLYRQGWGRLFRQFTPPFFTEEERAFFEDRVDLLFARERFFPDSEKALVRCHV